MLGLRYPGVGLRFGAVGLCGVNVWVRFKLRVGPVGWDVNPLGSAELSSPDSGPDC